MSYILEALRKSEQARKGLAVPNLHTETGVPVAVERLRTRLAWPLLALALVVVNGAGLAWWLQRPQREVAASPRPAPAVAAPQPAPAPPPPTLEQALAELATDLPPLPAPAAPAAAPAKPAAPRAPAPRAAPPRPVAATAPAPVPDVAPQSARQPPSENAAGPAAAAAELPPLAIGGYIEGTDGQAGMVMVNDRLVKEGEEVLPGLLVEEVLPEGVVFSYRGRRFRR